jgi:hypothetical protein
MLSNKNSILIVTSLLFVITMSTLSSLSWAGEEVKEIPLQPATIKLQMTDGVVSGYIKDGTIREALEVMSSQHPFDYQGNELLFSQRVSGQFDRLPLLAVLRQLLTPFNYYLVLSKETGDIESLTLTSIIVASDFPESLIAPSQVDGSASTYTKPLIEMETGEEAQRSFMIEGEQSRVPQELLDSFYPVQEPGTEDSGPQAVTDEAVKELPIVDAIENDTGPVDPDISSEESRMDFDSFPQ